MSILDLDSADARNFFLRNDSYCNFCLPTYFNFQPLLDKLSNNIKAPIVKPKNSYTKIFSDIEQNETNYIIYTNKDGRLAWRPLQLINPVAYVYLVNLITEETAWAQIISRMEEFRSYDNIVCCSVPSVNIASSNEDAGIRTWFEKFENTIIKKSLDFRYMLMTDISNCYGSIYTHSIAWALHPDGKEGAKNSIGKDNLPNMVDKIIQDISHRQTNGIPQGSILMDFIAEIVLGYADSLLAEKIVVDEDIAEDSYFILRYRDDYRIFTNSKTIAERIARYLCEVLASMNMRLNENKTKITENIIKDAQKSDRLFWQSISKVDGPYMKALQIHFLSEEHPNSGSLEKALVHFCADIENGLTINEDLESIAGIIVDIAYRNPRTYPYVISILGRIASLIKTDELGPLFDRIIHKFSSIPNSEYLNIWLQRLSKQTNLQPEAGALCDYVNDMTNGMETNDLSKIWNYSVCQENIIAIFNNTPIINVKDFETMAEYPTMEEISTFWLY